MNVLDAFVITLGWDTKGLDRGEKDIRDKTKRVRDEARRDATDTESSAKRAAASVRTIRNEVAGLFLAFAGANTLKGFLTEMVTGAAAAGRLADNLGISIERLAGVRNAARAVGGKDADADTALSTLVGAFQNYQLTGTTGHDADFQGLGITLADLRDPTEALNRMAEAGERLSKPEFVARLQRIGIPQSVINSLEKGRKGYAELTAEGEKNANLHRDDAEAAQAFDKALNDLVTTIKGDVQPWLTQLLDGLNDFLKGGDDISAMLPIATGLVAAFGLAAAAATGPWLALASAIGIAIIAVKDWNRQQHMSEEERKRFDAEGARLRGQFMDQLARGDIAGAIGTIGEGFMGRVANGGIGADAPSAPGGVSGLYNVLARAYGKERADGIWAGIGAESGWNPSAVNKDSGAFGLGQWLGPRKRELFRRYGPNPTAAQQIEFLMWELNGGDPGGRSVLAQGTRQGALSAYVADFMRPGIGAAGDMRRGMAILGGRPMPSGSGVPITNTTSVGQIIVYSPDPQKAGENVREAIGKRGLVVQANTGMTQ